MSKTHFEISRHEKLFWLIVCLLSVVIALTFLQTAIGVW